MEFIYCICAIITLTLSVYVLFTKRNLKLLAIIGGFLSIAVSALLFSATKTPTECKSQILCFGSPCGELEEGFHFIPPWCSVKTVNFQTKSYSNEFETRANDAQKVSVRIKFNYRINKEKLLAILKNFGSEKALEENLIAPNLAIVIHDICATCSVEQLQNRDMNLSKNKELAELLLDEVEKVKQEKKVNQVVSNASTLSQLTAGYEEVDYRPIIAHINNAPTNNTTNPQPIAKMIEDALQARIANCNYITIDKGNVEIDNVSYDKAYANKIAKRQELVMDIQKDCAALEASIVKYDKEMAEANGDYRASIAEGEAEQQRLIQSGQQKAEATKISGDLLAEGYKKLGESLNQTIVLREIVERWNGQVPSFISTGNAGGMLFQLPPEKGQPSVNLPAIKGSQPVMNLNPNFNNNPNLAL